ncbi:hypothetical protein [Domibacillus tundrae]|uniref:hypothetical protein n=1 Tax=Domibacillus tundrae TaxID=1587527 RepID=UPI000A429D05|nr:hypothetical protein [Domibacillus tundrae]
MNKDYLFSITNKERLASFLKEKEEESAESCIFQEAKQRILDVQQPLLDKLNQRL